MKEILALIVVVILFFLCIPKLFAENVVFQKTYFESREMYLVARHAVLD